MCRRGRRGYDNTVTAMIATASLTHTIAQTATTNHPSGIGLIPGKRLDGPRSFPTCPENRNLTQKCVEIGGLAQ